MEHRKSIRAYTRRFCGSLLRYITRPWNEIEVSFDECVNFFACSFGPNGWHPVVETLRQVERDPNIPLENTVLYRYHRNFCPEGIADLLPDGKVQFRPSFGLYPWGSFKRKGPFKAKDRHRTTSCGPSDEKFIAEMFDRILTLYHRLQKEGYQPWRFGNNVIGGTVLEDLSGARRVVILQGNHRMAVLAALGMKRIRIRFLPDSLRIIREADVDRWHFVKSGECSKKDALAIFRLYFQENGHHIARYLNLHPTNTLPNVLDRLK
jgi:hypothetical protein